MNPLIRKRILSFFGFHWCFWLLHFSHQVYVSGSMIVYLCSSLCDRSFTDRQIDFTTCLICFIFVSNINKNLLNMFLDMVALNILNFKISNFQTLLLIIKYFFYMMKSNNRQLTFQHHYICIDHMSAIHFNCPIPIQVYIHQLKMYHSTLLQDLLFWILFGNHEN